jgi:hypothetical protein
MRNGGWIIIIVLCCTLGACATTSESNDALSDLFGWIPDVVAGVKSPADTPPVDSGPEVPPPSSIRSIRTGPTARCANGHTFRARCVRARGGEVCFFETDDGSAFDCETLKCRTVPDELLAWCSQR